SVAMGDSSSAGGTQSFAVGSYTQATGQGAVAMGSSTVAIGNNSFAMGGGSQAKSSTSFAMGSSVTASGESAVAMGGGSLASGSASFAMGSGTQALGTQSVAMGGGTVAIGSNSVAMGGGSTASGIYSMAMGLYCSAEGDYSATAGRKARAGHNGTFVWADSTDEYFSSTADKQFLIRAAGGVGIGTFEPQAELHVEGGLIATGVITGDGSGLSNISATDNTKVLKVGDTMAGTLTIEAGLHVSAEATPNAFVINGTTGNVGIRTNNPSATLEVRGTLRLGYPGRGLYLVSTADDNFRYLTYADVPNPNWAIGTGTDGTPPTTYDANRPYIYSDSETLKIASGNMYPSSKIWINSRKLLVTGSLEVGSSNVAGGTYSSAFGFSSTADGAYSFAAGQGAKALGSVSRALGSAVTAGGLRSTAMGRSISVEGTDSFGIGLVLDPTPPVITSNNVMAIMGGKVGIGTAEPQSKLHVVGTIETTGNGGIKFQDGTTQITAGGDTHTYGEIYVSNNSGAQGLATQNMWYQVTSFESTGQSNNTTPSAANDDITVSQSGIYMINASIAFSGTPIQEIEFEIQKNNGATPLANLYTSRKLGANGDVGAVSISGLANLSATDTVELWIRNVTAGGNSITIEDANMTLVKID
ncbi:hypothetical protein ACFLZ2_06215, partial [Candidatus Margulisiibacteriota bacterium]